jgi:hypothetical protein
LTALPLEVWGFCPLRQKQQFALWLTDKSIFRTPEQGDSIMTNTTAHVPAFAPKGLAMFYVPCPCCESSVEVPSDSVGSERQHLWNVIVCDVCDAAFDYDDGNIHNVDDQPAEFVA